MDEDDVKNMTREEVQEELQRLGIDTTRAISRVLEAVHNRRLNMSKQTHGGPAFPTCVSADAGGGLNEGYPGMDLRDYFAAAAMTAGMTEFFKDGQWPENWRQGLATDAYTLADAMIAARSETT